LGLSDEIDVVVDWIEKEESELRIENESRWMDQYTYCGFEKSALE